LSWSGHCRQAKALRLPRQSTLRSRRQIRFQEKWSKFNQKNFRQKCIWQFGMKL
jgi:hypothetical protein